MPKAVLSSPNPLGFRVSTEVTCEMSKIGVFDKDKPLNSGIIDIYI